jgi:hypothetical protein
MVVRIILAEIVKAISGVLGRTTLGKISRKRKLLLISGGSRDVVEIACRTPC